MNEKRMRRIKEAAEKGAGPVIYWMSRDQRVRDNWALLHAQELASREKRPLLVVFCMVPRFLGATLRQYQFMIEGLKEIEKNLGKKFIPFCVLRGKPQVEMPKLVKESDCSALITDFDPLRIKKKWKEEVKGKISIPFYEVDAHNVVPCWLASSKQEYAAYTIRSKIKKFLPEFLTDFPRLRTQKIKMEFPQIDWSEIEANLSVDRSVPQVNWIIPGEAAAHKVLKHFISHKLSTYAAERNDPTKDQVSHLSPYLHFGQISAQRVAWEVKKAGVKDGQAFLEELVIRKELSDNYCHYNQVYDSFHGFPDWARKTLDEHRRVPRPYVYSFEQFEAAMTHDDLWNAAQMEMVERGKMHGYLRMYWAKKILEWTTSPEEALRTAISLNDKYELDGRDPNGYAGIAWSIGGVHDRAWPSRPVFGKIRYMSYNGCKSKFDVQAYIHNVNQLRP